MKSAVAEDPMPTMQMEQIVSIDQLVLDPKFQVRNKLNDRAIRRYAELYRAGRRLDPIRVAVVDGMWIVVDGWHRVNALRETGKSQVNAVLEPMTRKDALWAASVANAKHGVQLSRAEHVNVFKNYIAAGKHIKRKSPHGAVYKSYRDIADELPVGRTYGTIFNWMKRHFPSIAKAMSGSDLPPADGGLRDANQGLEDQDKGAILSGELLAHFQSVSDPAERGAVIGEVRELLVKMEGSPGWTEPPGPEF